MLANALVVLASIALLHAAFSAYEFGVGVIVIAFLHLPSQREFDASLPALPWLIQAKRAGQGVASVAVGYPRSPLPFHLILTVLALLANSQGGAAQIQSCVELTQDLSALKALGQPSAALPNSIIAEAVVSLLIFIPAIALAYPPLQDVTYRGELAKRTPDDMDARMGFMRFSARGAALFGDRS